MEKRVYNFSPGPAVLPLPALEEAQRNLLALPGTGISILEISHRSKKFEQILAQAEANLRTLLGIPDNYRILFLQGGALLQFGMIPMSFLRNTGKPADYIVTGTWSKKAADEAKTQGTVQIAFDGKAGNYNRVPKPSELKLDPNAAYAYCTSNETIQGVQFPAEPEVGDVPLVCDASSDFLSRPVAGRQIWPALRLCPEERRAGGRDDRDHPRRPAGQGPQGSALDAELSRAGGEQVALEHAADVRDLHGQAGDRLAAPRDRRPGEDGRDQPPQGRACSTRRSTARAASICRTPRPPAARS